MPNLGDKIKEIKCETIQDIHVHVYLESSSFLTLTESLDSILKSMFCTFCGAQVLLQISFAFCPSCGGRLRNDRQASADCGGSTYTYTTINCGLRMLYFPDS